MQREFTLKNSARKKNVHGIGDLSQNFDPSNPVVKEKKKMP